MSLFRNSSFFTLCFFTALGVCLCPRTLALWNTNRIHFTAEMAPKKKSGANAKAARAKRHSMVDAPTDGGQGGHGRRRTECAVSVWLSHG